MPRLSVERELENLKSRLARVEVGIKDISQQLERQTREETERIEKAQEQRQQQLLQSLQMATDAYANLLKSISSMFA